MAATTISLAEAIARHDVWDGDLLLFRGTGLVSRAIQQMGMSEYSHIAMLGWWNKGTEHHPMVLETREFKGSRSVTLASQVERNPGRIDVYRLRKPVDVTPAVNHMIEVTGRDYGYASVFYAALRHAPVWRWLVPVDTDDAAIDKRPPFCSQLVDQAMRLIGLDPAKRKAGRITEPGDIAKWPDLEYQYTLGGLE